MAGPFANVPAGAIIPLLFILKAKAFILAIGWLFAAFVGRAQEFSCGAKAPEFAPKSSSQPSLGVHRIPWYRIGFAGDSRSPATQEQAVSALQSANAILQRISYGKVSLTWTVTPLLELPQTSSYYAANFYTSFLTDARAAAVNAGFNPGDLDHDLLAPPPFSGFPSGLAGVGGRWVYLSVPLGGVVVHELGHNFGLSHANSRVTPAPATNVKDWPPFPSNVTEISDVFNYEHNSLVGRAGVMVPGRSAEYGDLFDIMGTAAPTADINLDYKRRLGWISDDSITNVVNSGVYRIYTAAVPTLQTGRRYGIRIDRPAIGHQEDQSSKYYWVQVDDTQTNVFLRWSDGSGPSLLINSAAAYFPSFDHAALPIGRAFDDPRLALTIKPLASGGTAIDRWIDVSIDFNAGDEEDDNPPLLPELPGA